MRKVLVGYISEGKADGINSYIKNFYQGIKEDDVQVDFLTRYNDINLSDLDIDDGKVYRVSRNRNPIKQIKEMKKIIGENQYDVAYFNISESYNCIGVIAAKLFKVKKVVVHSHSSGVEKSSKLKSFICKTINSLCKGILTACTDTRLACSKKAAEWMYPKNTVLNEDYEIIYNTVKYDSFKFEPDTRERIRNELGIADKFVLGHIGRFSYPKNHGYLMDILKSTLEKRPDTVLVCAGDGPDFEAIQKYADNIGVSDKVIFLGAISNVPEVLQAFDVFLLPSRFEGLPIVAVEAQFSGVPCLLSANIDSGVVVSENTKLLPVGEDNVASWAEEIEKCNERHNPLLDCADNYKLEKQKKQFQDIVQKEPETFSNTLLLDIGLKILLAVHYLLNITCLYNGFSFLLPFAFLLMMGIVLFSIKNIKAISKDAMVRMLFAFLVSYGVTFLFSTNYNMMSSVKIAIWLVVNFAFVFGFNHLKTRNQMVFEIDTVLRAFVFICSLLNIFNLALLFGNVTKVVTSLDGQALLFGIAPWGRFLGNHYDPNYASICFGCAIIMAVYLMRKTEKTLLKVWYGFTIFLQSMYIIFAQSRTSKVTLLIGLVIYTFFLMAKKQKKFFSVKNFASLVPVICAVLILPSCTISLYNNIKAFEIAGNIESTEEGVETEEEEEKEEEEELIVIGRQDVSSSDVSNRRFDIWKSGLEISQTSPVYGIGFANIKAYALDKCSETYILNNGYKEFEAFHNMIMDVLVSQGILGLIVLGTIIIYFVVSILRKLKKVFMEDENAETTIMLMSCVVMLLTSSMFLSEIFYVNNACTYVFWLLLGYLYYFLKKKQTIC